jgi:hypothetical protein
MLVALVPAGGGSRRRAHREQGQDRRHQQAEGDDPST